MSILNCTSIENKIDQNSPLMYSWNMYYHLPAEDTWQLITSYKEICFDINTVNKMISINESVQEKILLNYIVFVMKSGISPMWEDPKNKNGGSFCFKVLNKHVYTVWKTLFYLLCGGSLCIDTSHLKLINGITISSKKNFCIIKIWMADCSIQTPSIFVTVPNLPKQGCLFKKHEF